ncbi:hypothetical protein [Streptomyces sp. NPDC101234]|uniref:hypothetical protein n=1 Tax=Streptomyces sp. NPDC101234 TaxID=3366138 RepID=UPI003828DF5E
MDVKRLAALDMYGTRGTRRRRRIVLVEYIAGVIVASGLGLWVLLNSSSTGGRVFGAWLIAVGVNYIPLASHAIRLSAPGGWDAELVGVDVRRELARFGILQLWIVVPLAVVFFAVRGKPARTG